MNVWIFTNKITRPIRKLTDKTEQLKKAVDTDSKNHVIDSLEQEDIFQSLKNEPSTKAQQTQEIDEIEELKKLFRKFVTFKDDDRNFKYYAPRYYEKPPQEVDMNFLPPPT